jgi:hypothetical protein
MCPGLTGAVQLDVSAQYNLVAHAFGSGEDGVPAPAMALGDTHMFITVRLVGQQRQRPGGADVGSFSDETGRP